MVLSWIYLALLAVSVTAALILGKGAELAAAIPQGAQAGLTLALSIGGSVCLWTGVGRLLEGAGVTQVLAKLLSPLLSRIFPSFKRDKTFSGYLSANVCANLLGMGNAATPMGIRATQALAGKTNGIASDELCRLIVLNTASIQLLPTTVAALRAGLGCAAPFDILPAVWVTSLCSAGMGLVAAWLMGKLWRR